VKLSLYQRLALSLVVVFITMMVVFVCWTGHLQSVSKLEAEQRLHLGLAEHLVQDNPLLEQGVYDYEALKNLFHTLMVLGPSFEFYYLDPQGKILTYSAKPGKVKRSHIDLAPIKQLTEQAQKLPIVGDDPRNLDKQKIFSAAPVFNQGQLQGYLYMIIGGEIHDSIFTQVKNNHALRQWLMVAVFSSIFMLVALLSLFRFFTTPLNKLTREMKELQAADFKSAEFDLNHWQCNSDNEIQQLGCAFGQMVQQIQCQFQQLQQIDEHRRVLLADLSHDLRTPLANLQGYIETLSINSDNLSEQEKRRFIDISLKNAKNLKRLIDQIFELAYLEGGQVTLNQESFPLGELLHDVIAKFTLKAQEKRISLQLNPNQFDYLVFADIGKLERVLTNLIENAIRHTPNEGSISIEIGADGDKIRVDVQDSGIGISQKELAYIFDARYRATNTQEDKTTHVGLGLAISKKLMALLNSDLRVKSEVGKGTCFSFDLKLVNG